MTNIVAVSYGSYTGCGGRKYVNRIELRADTTVVVVGEDSLYEGPPQVTCAAIVSSADFVVIPRPPGRSPFARESGLTTAGSHR